MSFKAILLEERDGKVSGAVKTLEESALPQGEVTVGVHYSTLNYKDGMILGGIGRLVRQYPHVPGVDFAGTVEASASPKFKPGDKVVLTGWRVGENQWGGYAQRARVKADWLVPLPKGMTTLQAMAVGTAGFTSMLAIMALEEHGLAPDQGEVLVTGAAGGVGSVAVAILAKLGYQVAASTGRPALEDYLKGLGASTIVPRAELAEKPSRPLSSERWAGAVDAVGGNTLANTLAQLKYHGSVAACGLAGGADFPASVIPFLLRGINLLGIDSVMCAQDRRAAAWQRLARDLPFAKLESGIRKVPLADVLALGPQILKGQVQGRVVVDVNG
ncbi:MAG TPA: MDR family oxidoreductase [Alphaproteobacteria bacterium]|nr:MDR family oxidoreductase [Alphaproteobacteria bacterium]